MRPLLSTHSVKWAVFLIAVLTALSGLVLIVLGVYALSDATTVLGQRTLPVLMLVLGALVFLISFLGVFGTATESRPILYGFLVGLLALIVVQLVVGIVALANNGAVDSMLDSAWQEAYDRHPRIIRDVQEERGCCGFRFVTDRAIPKTSPDACLKSVEFGYQVSCYRALVSGYRHVQNIIGATSIILSGIQIVAVFLTYMLIHHLPDPKHHPGGRPGTATDPLIARDYFGRPIAVDADANPYAPGGYYGAYNTAYRPTYPAGAVGVPPSSTGGGALGQQQYAVPGDQPQQQQQFVSNQGRDTTTSAA